MTDTDPIRMHFERHNHMMIISNQEGKEDHAHKFHRKGLDVQSHHDTVLKIAFHFNKHIWNPSSVLDTVCLIATLRATHYCDFHFRDEKVGMTHLVKVRLGFGCQNPESGSSKLHYTASRNNPPPTSSFPVAHHIHSYTSFFLLGLLSILARRLSFRLV